MGLKYNTIQYLGSGQTANEICKTLLGVKRSIPNLAVYGELGRFLFSLLAKQRALKFWIKVMKNPLSPQYQLYRTEQNRNFICKELYIYTSSYKTFNTTIYT